MNKVPDITLTSLDTIKAYDLTTGDLKFILDELQDATIANTQEKQDITGKGGRKLNSLKKNKAVTISGNNGLISAGLMEIQTGGEFTENDAVTVDWTDYITVKENKATTGYKATGTAGKEITAVYKKNSDGTRGDKLEQAATAEATGKFAYNPTSKELTFFENDIADDSEIIVCYKRQLKGYTLSNDSDKHSGKAALYIDGIGEDACANQYRVQIYVPKADFSGEFSFQMGGDQSVHAFEAESLAGSSGCAGSGLGSSLWTWTVFGVNEGDATVGG